MKNGTNKKAVEEQLTFDMLFDDEPKHDDVQTAKEPIANHPPTKNANDRTFPIQLIIDFDRFINYIESHSVRLTAKNEYIAKKYLPELNEQMSIKAGEATANSQQVYYPYIHFFYLLALNSNIIEKVTPESGPLFLNVTERWSTYKQFTDTEKYFLLLETFWVDVNWEELLVDSDRYYRVHLILDDIFKKLLDRKSGFQLYLTKNNRTLTNLIHHWGFFPVYLDWFGIWYSKKDQQKIEKNKSKNSYFSKSITLTPFGIQMVPLLMKTRLLNKWNLPLRRQYGEVNPLPGMELPDDYNSDLKKEQLKDQSSEPFYQAFTPLFFKKDLQQTLPRQEHRFTDGVHVFKVALSKTTWCKVVLSAHHTMEDLHNIIIQAFQFDNDHLYSFFMDGKKWSAYCIASPGDYSDDPNAAETSIGSVGMHLGQRFLYLYDYGDEWQFTITVTTISDTEPIPKIPYILEQKGNIPIQYD